MMISYKYKVLFFLIPFLYIYVFNCSLIYSNNTKNYVQYKKDKTSLKLIFNDKIFSEITYNYFGEDKISITPNCKKTTDLHKHYDKCTKYIFNAFENIKKIFSDNTLTNSLSLSSDGQVILIGNNSELSQIKSRDAHESIIIMFVLAHENSNNSNKLNLLIKNEDISFSTLKAMFSTNVSELKKEPHLDSNYLKISCKLNISAINKIRPEQLFIKFFAKLSSVTTEDNIMYTILFKNLCIKPTINSQSTYLSFLNYENGKKINQASLNVNDNIQFKDYAPKVINILTNGGYQLTNCTNFFTEYDKKIFEIRFDQIKKDGTVSLKDLEKTISFNDKFKNTVKAMCLRKLIKIDADDQNLFTVPKENPIQTENSNKFYVIFKPYKIWLDKKSFINYKINSIESEAKYNIKIHQSFNSCNEINNLKKLFSCKRGSSIYTYDSFSKTPENQIYDMIMDADLKNFVKIDKNKKTIFISPKELNISDCNYKDLPLFRDELYESKYITFDLYYKLNNSKDTVLNTLNNYLIKDYTIVTTLEKIEIKFEKGRIQLKIDPSYKNELFNYLKTKYKPSNLSNSTSNNFYFFECSCLKEALDFGNNFHKDECQQIDKDNNSINCFYIKPNLDNNKSFQFNFYEKQFNKKKKKVIFSNQDYNLLYKQKELKVNNDDNNSTIFNMKLSNKIGDNFFKSFKISSNYYDLNFLDFWENENKTVIANYYIRDKDNRVLIVYYPLRNSYHTFITDIRIPVLIDDKFNKFIFHLLKNRSLYNKVFVRLGRDKTKLIDITLNTKELDHLIKKSKNKINVSNHVDNIDEFHWDGQNSLHQDYNELIKDTSSFVDILYIDTLTDTTGIINRFKYLKNVYKIYFLNFLPEAYVYRKDEIEIDKIKKTIGSIEIEYVPIENFNKKFNDNMFNPFKKIMKDKYL